jgi:hypothetical protein
MSKETAVLLMIGATLLVGAAGWLLAELTARFPGPTVAAAFLAGGIFGVKVGRAQRGPGGPPRP